MCKNNLNSLEKCCENGRKMLREYMRNILSKNGFDIDWVQSHSVWEWEEDLHLGHYNIYPRDRRRIEDNIKYIFKSEKNA